MYTREEAVQRSLKAFVNTPGTCQKWTREIFGAPSAGDRDRDGDADAVDGWKSEPEKYRHYNDFNPPPGVPVAFDGGSRGYGHRAVSLGNGKIRSTDMLNGRYSAGRVGTTTIREIEKAMGVRYIGWSESITGNLIPKAETTRGKRIEASIDLLDKAKAKPNTPRAKLIQKAKAALKQIKKS